MTIVGKEMCPPFSHSVLPYAHSAPRGGPSRTHQEDDEENPNRKPAAWQALHLGVWRNTEGTPWGRIVELPPPPLHHINLKKHCVVL